MNSKYPLPGRELWLAALRHFDRLPAADSVFLASALGEHLAPLVQVGWLVAVGELTHVVAPFFDGDIEVSVDSIDEDSRTYSYRSPEQRSRIVTRSLDEIRLYRFKVCAFHDTLADLFEIPVRFSPRRRAPLVHDHLWYLGDMRVGGTHTFAPCFLGRALNRSLEPQVHATLAEPGLGENGLLIVERKRSNVSVIGSGHGVWPLADLLDGDGLDRAGLMRRLSASSAKEAPETPEWFDHRAGQLKLPHFERAEKLEGVQLAIINVFWKAPTTHELEWKDVKMQAGSASSTIDDAFGGKARRERYIETVRRGRFRLRRS